MPTQKPLVWIYRRLAGLFSNKTTHHPDRDGFLEFNNAENYRTWERRRRGGSHRAPGKYNAAAITAQMAPVMGMDYAWWDVQNATQKRYLMLAGRGDSGNVGYVYYVSQSAGTATTTALTLPDDHTGATRVFFYAPTMVQWLDRMLACTAQVTTYNSGTITVTGGSTTVTKATNWPTSITKGDIIYLLGCKYGVVNVNLTALTLDRAYTGTDLAASSAYKVYSRNRANFVIFDPNDTRQTNEYERVNSVGTISPPTQLTLAAYNAYYYHNSTTNGWVYVGDDTPTNYTHIYWRAGQHKFYFANTANAASPYTLSAADDLTAKVAEGDHIYIDDVEYEVDTVALQSINWRTATEIGSTDYTDAAVSTLVVTVKEVIEEPTEFIRLLATNNELGDTTHRWSIWYGDIPAGDGGQYTYSYCYYNSHSGHCSNAAPPMTTVQAKGPFNVRIATWGASYIDDTDFYDTIVFLRTQKDGLTLYEAGRQKSTDSTAFIDHKTDTEVTGAGVGMAWPTLSNDPPPELLQIADWDGRIWGIQADQQNNLRYSLAQGETPVGRAEECWPPDNFVVLPSEDGRITGIKRAGDWLYVSTDFGLYVVGKGIGANYGLQRVFGGAGVKEGCMTEYIGPKSTQPGLFFFTSNYKAYIISPSEGMIHVGEPIEDKLQDIGDANATPTVARVHVAQIADTTLFFTSNKNRNYMIVGYPHASLNKWECYIYDIDLDAWYFHEFASGTGNNIQEFMTTTQIYGYPQAVGTTYVATDGIYILKYYNDACLSDAMTYSAGFTGGTAFTANMQTSWLDFDDRNKRKTMNLVKLYVNTGGAYTYDLYRNEDTATPIVTAGTFTTQGEPHQGGYASGNREVIAFCNKDFATAGKGPAYGHCFSFDIKFPNAAINESVSYSQFQGDDIDKVSGEV